MKYRKQFDFQVKSGSEADFVMAWTEFLNEILPQYPIKDVQLISGESFSQKVVIMEFLDERSFQNFWMNREQAKSYINLVKCFSRREKLAKEVTVDLFKATQEIRKNYHSQEEADKELISPVTVRAN